MEGIDSPCWVLTGLNKAPVATNKHFSKSVHKLFINKTRKHSCRTAASTSSGMCVLFFTVVYHKTAVIVYIFNIEALFSCKFNTYFPSYGTKVPCQYKVIAFRSNPVSLKWVTIVSTAAGAMAAPILFASLIPCQQFCRW